MLFEELNYKLGAKLKYYRLLKSFTQEELSEKIGVNAHYISDIERGTRNITLKTLYRLATILEVDIYRLFYFD